MTASPQQPKMTEGPEEVALMTSTFLTGITSNGVTTFKSRTPPEPRFLTGSTTKSQRLRP
ncbi:hypothetical protein [Vreelandella indica]|uniref:hypothetical protein n=1 Tax=Vreelandella indica TaxID=3126500 RepID=UPI00300DE464